MKATTLACFLSNLGVIGLIGFAGAPPAQAQPAFTGIQSLPNREIRLGISSAAGQFVVIERSTDLREWRALSTLAGATSILYTNTDAVYHRQGFYRLTTPAGTGILTGDHLTTDNGDVVVQPKFHATFVMKWDGKMIYVDPDNTTTYTGLAQADLILVTHSHNDHFDASTIESVRKPTGTVIIAPQDVYNAMSTAQKSLTTVLVNGASTTQLGVGIQSVPAYNPAGSGTIYHAQGACNGYVVTIGGRRIYIAGDTGDIPETRALQNIDMAFVCMNIPFTMTVDQAISVVRAFRPKVVYPYHYRNSNGTFSDLSRFKSQVGTDLGIEVRLGKWY